MKIEGAQESSMAEETRKSTISSVRAVDRAIAILRAFHPSKPSMSAIEIQEKVGLNRPTVYRMLDTLAAHGLIREHGKPKRFSLDYVAGQLAQSWLAGLDPITAARSIIERLHKETQETVSLVVLQGDQHLCVMELPSPHILSISRGIGPLEHRARGASGKAILAFLDDTERRRLLRTLPKDLDINTLMNEIKSVRKLRYAVVRSEIIPGAVAIASPYFDQTGRAIGAIVVLGPEVRMNGDRIRTVGRLTREAAAEVSISLGHVSSRPSLAQQRRVHAIS